MICGLTGIIGSGKSTVAKEFEDLGAFIIDMDKVGHWALETSDTVKSNIRKFFGDDVFDGDEIDRKKMGAFVFQDANRLRILNAIVHPIMTARAAELARQAADDGYTLIIVDAALIFEVGFEMYCDAVITVTSPVQNCIERVQKRSQLTVEHIRERLASQLSQAEKAERADYVIENDAGLQELNEKVKELFDKLSHH